MLIWPAVLHATKLQGQPFLLHVGRQFGSVGARLRGLLGNILAIYGADLVSVHVTPGVTFDAAHIAYFYTERLVSDLIIVFGVRFSRCIKLPLPFKAVLGLVILLLLFFLCPRWRIVHKAEPHFRLLISQQSTVLQGLLFSLIQCQHLLLLLLVKLVLLLRHPHPLYVLLASGVEELLGHVVVESFTHDEAGEGADTIELLFYEFSSHSDLQ